MSLEGLDCMGDRQKKMVQGRAPTNQGPWETDFQICLTSGLMLYENTREKFS